MEQYNHYDDDLLHVANRAYRSRLVVGTVEHLDPTKNSSAPEASEALIPAATKGRANLSNHATPQLVDCIDTTQFASLSNSAGCDAENEAIRTSHPAREAGRGRLV